MTSRQGLALSGYCQGIDSTVSLSKHQSTLKLLSAAGFIPSFVPIISESDY
nr:hypothetical protein [Moraxella osloensis]